MRSQRTIWHGRLAFCEDLMLVIKCSACKRKLWKYDKVGQGQVLRCYKDRITKEYNLEY